MLPFAHREANEFFFPASWLSDTQIASVINYIRSHFDNHFSDAISATDVAALHAKDPAK